MPASASLESPAFPLFGNLAALETRGASQRAGRKLHCRVAVLQKLAKVADL